MHTNAKLNQTDKAIYTPYNLWFSIANPHKYLPMLFYLT
ncbi:hypothetical protein P20495_3837 [Pseudoalteromonas sp. BSi20495]|nr:hypothetical protein P20495_3837 [Pseudoalteromonas sp. BSi20495]